MSGIRQLRAAEWRANWPLVLACFFGMSFPVSAYYALGLFITPLSEEFGWSRTQISAGASIAALVTIPCAPFIGAVVDRWGSRRIVLPGAVVTILAMASFGQASGSPVQWMALWAVFALASLLLKSTVFAFAISGRFDAARSFALAIVLSGTALSTTVAPPLTRWLIDSVGWRDAWMYLAVGWGVPSLILCAFFLFDAHDDVRRARRSQEAGGAPAKSSGSRPDLPGITLDQAWRSMAIWRIALATLVTLLFSTALAMHMVPILEEVGLTRESAAWLAGLYGIAGLTGSLVAGWLMDRVDAGRIGFVTNTTTAFALVFLLEQFRTPTLIVVAMLVVGFASGAKLELCAYMTSRYAGLRNYGKIFGVMGSIVAVTGAVGALLGGLAYDLAGSYDTLILLSIPAGLISAGLIVGIGPYPVWEPQRRPDKVGDPAEAIQPS